MLHRQIIFAQYKMVINLIIFYYFGQFLSSENKEQADLKPMSLFWVSDGGQCLTTACQMSSTRH